MTDAQKRAATIAVLEQLPLDELVKLLQERRAQRRKVKH